MTAETATQYAGVLFTAGVASAINSIAGGGTFLTFPALTGLAHLSEKAANMTSTVGLWPGSAASIAAARPDFKLIPRRLIVSLCITSLFGGILGSCLLLLTPNATFRLVIPWLLLFATGVFAFSKAIARWSVKMEAKGAHASLGWRVFVISIQFCIAIYGGYFGAGIGVLMLAGLAFTGLEHVHQMNALKVLLATIINGAAAIIFVTRAFFVESQSESIHWPLALGMVAAAIIGGFAGMHFGRRVPQSRLRIVILAIALALTAIYFYRAYFVG